MKETSDKTDSTKWEKIFANDMTDKGSNFKIYKQLIQLNEKIKQPNLKMGGRPDLNRHFIKTYRWPTSTGKDAQYH